MTSRDRAPGAGSTSDAGDTGNTAGHGVGGRPGMLVLRSLIAVALIMSAVIHFQLAAGFQQAAPSGIGGGNLFRIQGAVAVLAALYALLRGTQRSYLLAGLVALASLAAVIAYRYIQIPTIGPIPSMYEPVWYTSKTITAVAEALALVLALTAYTLRRKSHH